MHRSLKIFGRRFLALVYFLPVLAAGQTLTINNDVQTYATLTNTAVTMTGKAELRITGTGDPIAGCTINLNSPDAWFFMTNIVPSAVSSTFLGRVLVNGAAAVIDSNVRVVQYGMGAVVIPHAPTFTPLEVFDGKYFTGPSKQLHLYTGYNDLLLGTMKMAIGSFKLKRGYMATFATNENGTGTSRCYVAQEGDLEVGLLPSALDNSIRFVRIFPWRWAGKKGIAGNIGGPLKVLWWYNWNLDQNSPLDSEYVAIRQTRSWPGLGQDWKARGINHLLGYNEPDQSAQANLTVAEAIASWPDLLATGLRVGAPAVSDGGLSWLYSFIDAADAAGLRVDFVPVHYYRSYSNPANASGAASQLYNFVKAIYDRTGRPVWLTEFNNGANWTSDPDPTAAQQAATVAAMIDMLDNAPFVERYAIYNWVEDVRRVEWDDGSLTAAGVNYRDNASPIFHVQEMADAGTGTSARYPFDGDAHDAWGNGQDAMLVGAPTFTAGKYGQAIVLDGSTDYLQLSPRLADNTDFTFAGWVKWGGGGSWQRVFDFGADTSHYLFVSPKTSGGNLRFAINTGSGEQQLSAAALTAGVWTHVAVTISGDTGKLFVNGALVATNTAMTYNPVDVGTKFNFIGKSQVAADPLFNGQLDDLRFISSALSDAQIAAIASTPPPQFSATMLLKPGATKRLTYTGSIAGDASGGSGARTFTKMSGPAWLAVAADGSLTGVPTFTDGGVNRFLVRVTDSIGSLTTATLQITVADAPGLVTRYAFESTASATAGTADGVATAATYVAGKYGAAIDLDGTTGYVTLPRGVVSHDEITIATWVNWDGTSQWQRIFDFGNGTGEYLFLTPRSGSNTMRFEIKNNGTAQTLNATQLATGQWVHVAITLGAGVGKLYVNGTLADTQAITIKPTDFEPVANFLGDSQFAPDPFFNGRIDEFMVFNELLSAAQISGLVSGRAPAFTADPIGKPAATAGQIYEQTLAGSATDPDAGSTLTFSKVSDPAWLTVSPDGRIYGVPTSADSGTNRFIVRVTDQALLADDATLNIVVPASSGLIVHYQFDGNTNDNAGGAAGVTTGSPAYEAGIFDKALGFDGTDDLVTLPANIASGLTDATFAACVRWDGGSAWQRIFDFGSGGAQYLILTPSSGNGTAQFAILNSGGSTQRLEGPSPLPVGEWAHIAVTLIGNTGTLYVNGAAVASTTITIDPSAVAQTANYLGDSQFTADPIFNGAIDDFRIYNRGLAAAEVAALAIPSAPVSVPDSSFSAWVAGYSFPSGQSGAQSDPDKDGVGNAWEYLTGTNPLLSGSGSYPQPQVMTAFALGLGNTGKSYLTIQARIRKQHLGATFVPEAAATIQGLALPAAASHALQAGPPIADGAYDIFTYYFDTALEDSPGGAGFIRVRAVLE